MMENRNKLTIMLDMLDLIKKEDKLSKTQLRFKVNINHTHSNKYLNKLKGQKLIQLKKIKGSKRFYNAISITQKGKIFLEQMKRNRTLQNLLGDKI